MIQCILHCLAISPKKSSHPSTPSMVLPEKKKAKSGEGSADAADETTKIILVSVHTYKFVVVP